MTIGIIGWLTIAFVIMKLAGIIAWSWWWVFSPLWICFLICLVGLIIVSLIAFVVP
jgi:hypothetical protein